MMNQLIQLTEMSGSQMMVYILTLQDGRFIVIDGGTEAETDEVLSLLRERSAHPCVAAWLLTHAHYDHITAFLRVMRDHREEVTVERVLYNFPSQAFLETYEPNYAFSAAEFSALLPMFADAAVVVNTGDRFTFGEVQIDVLHTPDPALTGNAINNSSVVFAIEVSEQKLLFLGDLGVAGGKQLLEQNTPEQLRADVCQMAHHGQSGVDRAVYEAIGPRVCLWSTPAWRWDNVGEGGPNTGPWKTVAVRGWMQSIGVAEHYVSKDGVCVLGLPL